MEFPSGDLECRVEHLLCTRPVASASPCSVIGMCVSPTSTLFAFLSTGKIQAISLPSVYVPPIPLFHLQNPKAEFSPLRKVSSLKKWKEYDTHTCAHQRLTRFHDSS